MKKNNKKGFVLAETIAVSVIIMTSLVIVYTQFATLNNSYKTSFQYNNVNNLYLVNNLRNFIKDDGLDRLIQLLDNNEYIDITSCPSYLFDEYLYCRLLVDSSNMKTVLFTKEDISELKNSIDNTNYSQTMKNYIKKINNSTGNSQRLIVEFEDETYATLLFVFNEEEDNFAMAPVSFEYTGGEQSFTVPHSGYYKLEAWGAGSGEAGGAYTSGIIYLNEGEKVYAYVGEKGFSCSVYTQCDRLAYNGGGKGGFFTLSSYSSRAISGGGATDFRLNNGAWNDTTSLVSRIMVASGAGGSVKSVNGVYNYDVTFGGTINGYKGYTGLAGGAGGGYGATQTSGGASGGNGATAGSFGIGGNGYTSLPNSPNCNSGLGGGGGYYGGGGGRGGAAQCTPNIGLGMGGSGSSYISGYPGCIAIKSATDITPKVTTYSKIEDSYHYSGKIFKNPVMIAGNKEMPTHDGTSTMVGNVDNGYAKISYIGQSF